MLLLGLVVVALGVALIAAGVFTAETSVEDGAQILGIDVTPPTLFVLGLLAGIAVIAGLWLAKSGAKRSWRQRREQKRMDQLSEKLERAERHRDRDLDRDEPKFG